MHRYLLMMLFWGGAFAICSSIFCLIRKFTIKRSLYIVTFAAYIGCLLSLTLLYGTTYPDHQYQLIPFITLIRNIKGQNYYYIQQVLVNIVMFLPMGVLFKIKDTKLKYTLASGFIVSLLIESAQFILKRGVFDVDDLILNTLGTLFGFIIAKNLTDSK